MKIKKILVTLLPVLLILTLASCKPETKLTTTKLTIEHETKFGGAYLHLTIDEFNELGFKYGDSLDVEFSNGLKFTDVPYYTGYYTNKGGLLMVAYPGYPYIKLCENNGDDIYLTNNMSDNLTAVVSLHEAQKYSVVQESLSVSHSNLRDDFESDEMFANFRVLDGGNIKQNYFYRGVSPCDNQYNRAEYASLLCEKNNVKFIIDLADSEEEVKSYYDDSSLNCSYWKGLYENSKVLSLDMTSNYSVDSYKEDVMSILSAIASNEGPFYIHCTEGKDRTGFVCLLIETLAGYTKDEVIEDYMKTYSNYYGITKEDTKEKYDTVVNLYLSDMFNYLCGESDVTKVNNQMLYDGVINYLKDSGKSDPEITNIVSIISK